MTSKDDLTVSGCWSITVYAQECLQMPKAGLRSRQKTRILLDGVCEELRPNPRWSVRKNLIKFFVVLV